MKNVLLIGTCRIHRPLFNFKSTKYCFLDDKFGTLAESNQIIQYINLLNNKSSIPKCIFPYISCYNRSNYSEEYIEDCKMLFNKADIVLIELSSIKECFTFFELEKYYLDYFKTEMNPPEFMYIKNTELISENNICRNIKIIQKLCGNKKVMFVSHFNVNNIPQRELIIKCIEKTATYYYNPTEFVSKNLPNCITDINHYSKEFEPLIAQELVNVLDSII